MFDIEYKGGTGVVISTKKGTLVVDPKLSTVGLKDVNVKDMLELATEPRFMIKSKDAHLVIEGPGEYETGIFSIRGIAAQRHIDTEKDEKNATIYRVELGDVRIAVLGNIAPQLTEAQLEELGVIDIAIIPVGGGGLTLDATSAAGLIRKIDPKAVIPTHYADSALKYEMPQDTLETFIKELGAPVETYSKYKIKSVSSLPAVLTTIEVSRS